MHKVFQLASEKSIASDPSTTGHPLVYAGFWSRTWASLIDTVVQLVVLWPILYAVKKMGSAPTTWMELVVNVVIPMLATVWMWGRFGATPGKMVIGAKVVDARTGQSPSTKQSVVRYLCYFVSAIPLGLGFFVVAWSDKKQGWHDKIADTVVVRPGEWQLNGKGALVAVE